MGEPYRQLETYCLLHLDIIAHQAAAAAAAAAAVVPCLSEMGGKGVHEAKLAEFVRLSNVKLKEFNQTLAVFCR